MPTDLNVNKQNEPCVLGISFILLHSSLIAHAIRSPVEMRQQGRFTREAIALNRLIKSPRI